MSSWLERFLGRVPPAGTRPAIAVDDTGFSLTQDRHARAIPWPAIRKVAAYKQDLGTSDRIVLVFEVELSGDPFISVTEESPGFADLFGPMEQALGINPSWYFEMMTPAFAATPVALYVRPDLAS